MNDRAARPRRTLSPLAGGIAAFLTLCWQVIPLWNAHFPSPSTSIILNVTFPTGVEGRCEPIITTGRTDDGDFLAIRYLNQESAVVLYDVWGVGGPTSPPFALQPGRRRTLRIEMPTLAQVPHFAPREKRPLRVVLDGEPLLNDSVFFHRRMPADLFFASNPIGGTLVDQRFRGQLTLPDGKVLRGGPQALFGWTTRLVWIVRTQTPALLRQIAIAIAVGIATAWIWPRLSALRFPQLTRDVNATARITHSFPPHAWFGATVALCAVAFVAVLTSGTFQMITADEFSNLYDVQARSFLQGRLSLPDEARTGESFIFEGRNYMYFGPTPALLRMPFTILNIAFGKLGRCFMLGYFIALLAGVYVLQIYVARLASGGIGWPSRCAVVLFVATVGLGTTLFFLSSRTYIYHEAILCGAMFALWSGYFSLRYLAAPNHRWWMGALACGLFSVHARPPSGLFALALVGCAAALVLVQAWMRWKKETHVATGISGVGVIRSPLLVGMLAIGCVLSFNGLSYLKFKSFEGAPLKYHVQYQEGRLAAIDGKNFHLSNFRFNFDAYVWRPDFVIRKNFPYFYIHNSNDRVYPNVKNDLFEPTLALPYAMPALVFLGALGGVLAFVTWPAARPGLSVITLAGAVMALALFTAVAVSHRYTGDFCPPLILTGAFGLQSSEWLAPIWRRVFLTLAIIFAACSIPITSALTLHYQGALVWGVPADAKARYESLRTTVDRMLGLDR
jgi:hypothetical protein